MLFQRDNEGSVNGEIVRREKPLMVTNKVSVLGVGGWGGVLGRVEGGGASASPLRSHVFFHDIKENQIGNTQIPRM